MFWTRLERRIRETRSVLCIGLDPPLDLGEELEAFGRRSIDSAGEAACCVKPNSAFYEARGASGIEALRRTIEHAHVCGLPVILDCKRADVGSTAEAYAHAAFAVHRADAVTLNPYLGADGIAPFTRDESKGIFVLCRTSNPSASELQELPCGGEPLYRVVARKAAEWAAGRPVGLVMGATFLEPIADIRRRMASAWFLIPGIGAQGGSMEAVRLGAAVGGGGVVVNVSRHIIGDPDPGSRARELRDEINRHRDMS